MRSAQTSNDRQRNNLTQLIVPQLKETFCTYNLRRIERKNTLITNVAIFFNTLSNEIAKEKYFDANSNAAKNSK